MSNTQRSRWELYLEIAQYVVPIVAVIIAFSLHATKNTFLNALIFGFGIWLFINAALTNVRGYVTTKSKGTILKHTQPTRFSIELLMGYLGGVIFVIIGFALLRSNT